jgi:hypothetical protein
VLNRDSGSLTTGMAGPPQRDSVSYHGVLGSGRLQTFVWVVCGAILLAGIVSAIRLAWVCDDAFISFRYAENLSNGLGLVYNAGERVEGYSNFLWTIAMAAAVKAGLDPVRFSEGAGLVCFAATILLLLRTGLRIFRERPEKRLYLPLAAVGLSLHRDARVFATGGLETALFALLATAVVIFAVEARSPRRHLLVGFLAVLAALTRPDGGIFLVVAALAPLHALLRKRSAKELLFVSLPGLALYVPYLVWKVVYYGDILPNTFYAKSAQVSYFSQGLNYLGLYLRSYWILALGIAGIGWLLFREMVRGAAEDHETFPWSGPRAPFLLLATIALYATFVAKVGGDFMFARFLIPVTPLLFLSLELISSRWSREEFRLGFILGAVLATWASPAPPAELKTLNNPTGIVLERTFYPAERIAEARRLGSQLHELTRGLPLKVAIFGSQAMLAYYARFPYVIEAHTGLTDRDIARARLKNRGRIGHEKSASWDYLRKRGVDLVFAFGLYRPGATPLSRVRLGDVDGTLVTYRRELVDALRSRGAQAPDVPSLLDRYITGMNEVPVEVLRGDYRELKAYYFDYNDDRERRAAFERALGTSPKG